MFKITEAVLRLMKVNLGERKDTKAYAWIIFHDFSES